MFIQRALLTLILGPIALLLIYLGGLFYFIPIALVLLFATWEYTRMMRRLAVVTPFWLLLPAVALQWIVAQWGLTAVADLLLFFSLLAFMTFALFSFERGRQGVTASWWALSGGFLLLGWVCAHFFRLRLLPDSGMEWAMLAMLATWFADSGAYLVGKFAAGRFGLGRHRLSPRLSPNKTIEGFLGGVLLASGLTVLVASWLSFPLQMAFVLALAVGLLSPLGDLGISLLKRESGIKDSGTLFRGHGGALDRVDSLMWAVAIAYYLAIYFPVS